MRQTIAIYKVDPLSLMVVVFGFFLLFPTLFGVYFHWFDGTIEPCDHTLRGWNDKYHSNYCAGKSVWLLVKIWGSGFLFLSGLIAIAIGLIAKGGLIAKYYVEAL